MTKIIIVGAGVIGLSAAYHLLADGHEVMVIDRDPAGDKASFYNAGGIGISEILPASAPGVVWRIPGWFFDPLGPLSLKLSHIPALMPWLLRFLASGTEAEMRRVTAALAAIANRTYGDLMPMLTALGLAGEMHRVGALTAYETEAGFQRDQAEWDLKRAFGVESQAMTGDEAREREPALGPLVKRAVFVPDWSHLDDPKRVVDRLREDVAAKGATIETAEVARVDGKRVLTGDGRALAFERLVIAAGAWSARLSRQIGDRVLLESERGYNTTIPHPNLTLGREIIFGEAKFVATPMTVGLRIGGAAEFAGLEAPPNYQRSKVLVTLAKRYLPGLDATGGTEWMGHRPTTPDSLPVIGVSPKRGDVFYAFGHSHTGLTFAPTTGLLIAQLIGGRPPAIDPAPYSIARFA